MSVDLHRSFLLLQIKRAVSCGNIGTDRVPGLLRFLARRPIGTLTDRLKGRTMFSSVFAVIAVAA